LDANFISIYNPDKKDFDYFIQRLIGIEISNSEKPAMGKLWVPYVNARKEDWSYLCENNRIIQKDDEIVFKYESGF